MNAATQKPLAIKLDYFTKVAPTSRPCPNCGKKHVFENPIELKDKSCEDCGAELLSLEDLMTIATTMSQFAKDCITFAESMRQATAGLRVQPITFTKGLRKGTDVYS